VVYVREFEGDSYEFGVVGVEEGTLIMYDRQTRSWWSQLVGAAVEGPMEGTQLAKLPSVMTTWGKWKAMHPDTTVYIKPSTPYSPRFTGDSFREIASAGEGPIRPRDWIVGLEGHVDARAYLVRALADRRVLNDRFENAPILLWISEDLSTARVLDRSVDGRTLTFALTGDDRLRDEETGSIWDPMTGEATSGPLEGEKLAELVSTYSLWFAWERYRPDTVLVDGSH